MSLLGGSFPEARSASSTIVSPRILVVLTSLLVLFAAPSLGATYQWTGGAGNWNDSTKWSPSGVPGPADTANVTGAGTYTVTLNVPATVAALTIGCGNTCGSTITLAVSGNALTVNGPLTVNFGGNLNLSGSTVSLNGASNVLSGGAIAHTGGTLTGTGALTISGSYTWGGGTLSGTGATTVASSGSLSIGGPGYPVLDARALTNDGSITYSPTTSYLSIQNGAVLTNNNLFQVVSDAILYSSSGGVINNAGSFTKSTASGLTDIYGEFNNTGSVALSSGTVELSANGTHGGSFSIGNGATLRLNGGTHSFGAGTAISGAGTLEIASGVMSVDSALTIDAAIVSLAGGTLTGAANRTITNQFVLHGGTLSGTGTTTVAAATGVLTIPEDPGYPVIDGHTLINLGTATYSATGTYLALANGATLQNDFLFYITGSAMIYAYGSGPNRLVNGGTLAKQGVGTETIVYPVLESTGNVGVQEGTLTLNSGGSYSAQMLMSGGALVKFNGGTHSFLGGSTLGGAGSAELATGTLTFDGPATISVALLRMTGGTLGGSANRTINNALEWRSGTITGAPSTTTTVAATGSTLFPTGTGTGYGYPVLDAHTLVLNGPTTYSSSYYLYLSNGAQLTNGGAFTLTGDAPLSQSGSGNSIVNAPGGTITKSGGTGIATITPAVDNDGSIDAASGTLALAGGGTSTTGSFSASTGALRFSGGTHALGAGTTVIGDGQVEFTAGTVTIAGSYAVAGSTSISGGTAAFDAAASSASLTVSGGAMQGTGAFTVSGAFVFSGGTLSGSGSTTVLAGGSALFPNNVSYATVDGRTLTLDADAVYSGGPYYLSIYNGGVLAINGTFDIQNDQWIYGGGTGPPRIDNAGTVTKTAGTGESVIFPVFNNNGSLVVSIGSVSLNGGGTSSGAFAASSPGAIRFNGGTHTLDASSAVSGNGTMRFSSATTTLSGTYALSGTGLTLVDAGTHAFDAAASSPGFTISGGTLQGAGAFVVAGAFEMSGGTLKGPGSTTVAATGSALFPANSTYAYLDGRTLTLDANATYSGAPYYLALYNDAVLANNATFDIQNDAVIYSGGTGTPRIDNAGTFQKSGGTGETIVYTAFNNAGSTSVTTGTLSFNGGGTSPGSFSVSTPGTLRFNGGVHTLSATSSVGGTGTVRFSNGTTTLAGGFALTGSGLTLVDAGTHTIDAPASSPSLTISGGTLQGTGAFDVAGAFTFSGGTLKGPGTTTVAATGSASFLNNVGYPYVDGRTLILDGNSSYTGGPYYTSIYNDGVIENNATFTITNDTYIYAAGTGSPRIDNNGTFIKSAGAGDTTVFATFNNFGTTTVTDGSLIFQNNGTSAGSFVVTAPGELEFNGGTFTLGASSSVTGTGTVRLRNATTTFAGTFALTGSGLTSVEGGSHSFDAAASSPGLTITNGTMQGSGDFTISGPFLWGGGYLSGSGTTRVLASGTASFPTNTTYAYLDGRTLALETDATYSGGPYYLSIYNGGVLQNTATFTITNDTYIYAAGTGTPRIENTGAFQKTGGTGVSTVFAQFDNAGTVAVTAGTLSLTGGGSGAGSFDVTAPGILRFEGGTHTLSGAITSDGGIEVMGGSVNASGAFANSGLTSLTSGALTLTAPTATMQDLDLVGGTLAGSALIDVGGTMNWTLGTLGGATVVEIAASPGALNLTGAGAKYLLGATLRNGGTGSWSGDGWIYGNEGGALENLAGATFTRTDEAGFYYYCCTGAAPRFDNQAGATLVVNSPTNAQFYSAPVTNAGTVNVLGGTLDFYAAPFVQTGGIFSVASGAVVTSNTSVDFQGGALMGGGTFAGNVLNSGGSVQPGASPGALTISGDYTQGAAASLDVELGGVVAGTEFDQLNVTGTASLAGTLNVSLIPPYAPLDGDAYQFLTFGSLANSPNDAFTTVNGTDLGGGDSLALSTASTYMELTASANNAPVAVADSASVAEDSSVAIAVLSNDSDPNGDSLSITASTAPSNGSVSCTATTCTYTPATNFNGSDSFTYTISDGAATSTAAVTVTVTPVNDAPVAAADAATTLEDQAKSIAVTSNDTDIDGDALSATVAVQPANGSATCSGGSCTYTPDPGFNGTDTFTYTVTDGTATSASALVTVTVTPVNDAPVAVDDVAATPGDTAVAIPVLSNDSDPDGDAFGIQSWSQGSYGTVSCAAPSCTYTPNAGFAGTDAFTYTIADDLGATDTATVTVTVEGTTCPSPVVALAPSAGAKAKTDGRFSWGGGDVADSYSVYFGPVGSGCETLFGTTSLKELTYSNLAAGEYEWRVVANGEGCQTPPESACVRFSVVSSCPTQPPSPVAPAAGAEVHSPTQFQWSVVNGAVLYRLLLTTGEGTQELASVPQPSSPLPATVSATLAVPEGTSSWQVIADFGGDCASLAGESRTITVVPECPSGAPEPIAPLEGDPVDFTPAVFRWTAVDGAEGYEVFASINGGAFLSKGIAPATADPAMEVDVPAGATLSWYVDALFPEGCGIGRSRTVQVAVSCFPPVLSLQGEVTTGKPYQVRATIVSTGARYIFQESDSQAFTTVLDEKEGEVDPTGEFVFAMFEHQVAEPKPYFYRVKLDQQGCEFSGTGRIVVVPLPPPTSTEAQTTVQFGNEEQIRQPLFIASPTPDQPTNYSFVATTDRDWMRVEPATGTIGPAGITVTVITDPVGLPVGTNTGTITLTFVSVESGKRGLETTPITGSAPVSVTLVTPVTNSGKDGPTAESLIIPAVAHATGLNSEWQTDVRIVNLGLEKRTYKLLWTSTATDATVSGKSSELELAPGQSAALDDVVRQWYGLGSLPGENAQGVLEIRPLATSGPGKGATGAVTKSLVSVASSRMYNRTPAGTLGEFIPAIPFAAFVGGTAPEGETKSVLSLQQLAQSSAFRTNIGVTEASGKPVGVEMRFFDAVGTRILTVPLELRSGEHRQLNQILAEHGLTEVGSVRAEVEVVAGDGRITAYASVVDNASGDPLQVHAVDLAKIGARKYVMPGVAHVDTGVARWRSDVQVFNAGLAAVTAQVAFFPTGASAPTKTATIEVPAGAIQTLADIVPTLFGETNTGGAIQITTATESELVVTGRTYDQRETGSYGQFMAAVTEEEAIGLGDRATQVLQLEQSSAVRSNLGIVEVTGKPVRIELTAFPAESRVTPRIELTLKANEFRQLNQVLKGLNAGTTYNARVALRVIDGEGKIVAYGSTVDNMTQDPTFIPGQ